MATRVRLIVAGALTLAVFLSMPPRALSQEQGDLFGDLFEIKRDAATGQPILQKRWAELPGDEFGWEYCPIPVDAAGAEIPFAPLSCEVDPAEMDRVIEIDYFGRLNASRTRESNQRMHFNEVISTIKASEIVTVDEAGRVKLGTGCDPAGVCAEWSTIDSPMENMSLYNRLLKYGHIQTDPLEEDTSTGGDPNEGTRYYPALGPNDWTKFRGQLLNLLPRAQSNQCFTGPAPGTFVPACAAPQSLVTPDFIVASSFLGGAASKHNLITIDVIQYLNRFLKIPTATAETPAPVATLPALIRDEFGVIAPAANGLPFPASERFVDYAEASYLRSNWYNTSALLLQTSDGGLTFRPTDVELLQWLLYVNHPQPGTLTAAPAFAAASLDAVRVVEFIHEYALPLNLWGAGVATHTGPHGRTVRYRATHQNMQLTAVVGSTTPVNGGAVTFTVRTPEGLDVGTPVTSGPVVNGAASATYVLPGGTGPDTLAIVAVYSGTAAFAGSTGSSSLLIGQADTTTTVDVATVPVPMVASIVPLTARVSWADTVPIAEGSVEFAVTDAAGMPVGPPLSGAVTNGIATVDYLVPGGLSAQRLTTTAAYGGSNRLAASTGRNALAVGCLAVTILPFTLPPASVEQPFAVALLTDGITPVALSVAGTLPPGLTLTGSALSGTPIASGTFAFTVSAVDAAGCPGNRSYSLLVNASLNALAVGPGAGVPGVVRHFEPNGTQAQGGEYAPFTTGWTGGVRVARGDLTGDGVPDTIVGTGPGGQALIKAYNGTSQGLIGTLVAFEATYTGGVNVAVGDITGDGVVDVIAGTASGTPRVRIFNGTSGALMFDFVPFTIAGMSGVEVAAGDVNGDGLDDLIVGGGAGAEPWVKVFNAANGAVLHNFLAYPAAFRGGLFVAAGDVDADGHADIVTGPGSGGGPLVKVFGGVSGAEIRSFFAGDPSFVGGARVASVDVNADGHAEIVVAAGPGAPPFVKIFHGATSAELRSFLVYPPEVTVGVFVAAPVR